MGESPSRRAEDEPASILVVDDEPLIRETLREFLNQEGFAAQCCASAEEALEQARTRRYDIALCDINLPGMDGLELLDRLLKSGSDIFVVLITAHGTIESAIEAFQRGAHDYLIKPIVLDEVAAKIRRLLKFRELRLENQMLRRELNRDHDPSQIVGASVVMRQVFDVVKKVAQTPSNVLLLGESGTGKELIARAIHQQGPNPEGRFLAVNCAAIPKELLENQLFGHRKGSFTGADRDQAGVFVHAGSGTVFLDEIGDLPLDTQAKLLRAIEQKEVQPIGADEPVRVEARVLAATNKELSREVELGRFRDDLFYRLNVLSIRIPPLRDRREDIPALVEHLLAKHAKALNRPLMGVSQEAMRVLMSCRWRGNVRELDNALQRAVILGEGPLVTVADLPPDLASVPNDAGFVEDLGEAVRRFERQHIELVLRYAADKKEAARRLGMGLSSLYRRISELGLG